MLDDLLGEDAEGDFWGDVKTNLQAGRIRLVFVADSIPKELQRIVEFLNRQMDPAEVFAVGVRRFGGDGAQTLVPRVLGQTMAADARRSRGGRIPEDRGHKHIRHDIRHGRVLVE